MKKVFFIFACLLILASCDEIDKVFNPSSDDYLIKKTIQASSEEQIIESDSEFKMIFPANSISGELEVKVEKESSVPDMNIPNQKPGKNFFKIKFSGETAFLKPVQIVINYDKSAIPTGQTATETVKGFIYTQGGWKLADYQLDEPNGKIIISISSILGKTYKDEPILLDDAEIIIGDAYTTTDEGQDDNLLKVLHTCQVTIYSNKYSRNFMIFKNAEVTDKSTNPFSFSGDNFYVDYISRDDIDPDNMNPGNTFWFDYLKYKASGQVKNNSHSVLTKFNVQDYRQFHTSQIDWYDINIDFSLSDVKLTYQSKENDTLIYYLDKNEVNRCLNSLYYNNNHIWEETVYTQTASDVDVLILRFTK
ncbi:MAG: hypothetical protein M9949_01395 [Candidatus Kapabacteria bacterium]|nr:hypothetical protein [Candidatus Kapabacteria bacterium]